MGVKMNDREMQELLNNLGSDLEEDDDDYRGLNPNSSSVCSPNSFIDDDYDDYNLPDLSSLSMLPAHVTSSRPPQVIQPPPAPPKPVPKERKKEAQESNIFLIR
jgi:hypothetical protein